MPHNQISAVENPLSEGRLAEIAAGLADQFANLYGAEPIDPQAQMAGNTLNFEFQGGLTVIDERNLEAGRLSELRVFRERFLSVVARQLKSVVTIFTGAEVKVFSSSFDPSGRTTNILFVLDLLPDSAAEQRQAIRNWSEHVRRNARELRHNHEQTRATHMALREEMHGRLVRSREVLVRRRGGSGDSEDA